MRTFTFDPEPLATSVAVGDHAFHVVLEDGRELTVPLSWFPRLLSATPAQRRTWELIGGGEGIHWPEVDEDISVAGLLAGRGAGDRPSRSAAE